MNRKRLLLLAAALVVALVTALGARGLFLGAAVPTALAAPEPAADARVLVAQRELATGTIVTAGAVTFQAWPKNAVSDAYFVDGATDLSKLIGTVVRYPVPAGQPLTKGGLVPPGDRGFLAAALAPGMRAVTIAVSARTGVGGFVFPGDRVDLLLTQTIDGAGGSRPLKASETIVENLRVLATDQSTDNETVDGKTVAKPVATVTLEVTPRFAEKIAVAQAVGELGLSLRAIADDPTSLDRAIAGGAVRLPDNATRADEERLLAQAMDRPIDGGGYATGGDVSRFQRRTMPALIATASAPMPAMPAPPRIERDPAPRGPLVNVTRGKQTQSVMLGAD